MAGRTYDKRMKLARETADLYGLVIIYNPYGSAKLPYRMYSQDFNRNYATLADLRRDLDTYQKEKENGHAQDPVPESPLQ